MSVMQLWPESLCQDEFKPFLESYLLPEDGNRYPVIVIFPGGGYHKRAPHEGKDIALAFNKLGFQAVVVQYRVAPARYPAPQRDAFRAIKLVRANAEKWNIIPDQLVTCGFSAGGHLTASTGTLFDSIEANANDGADGQSQRPDAMILSYPVISFCDEWGHVGSGDNLLGDKKDEFIDEINMANRVTANTPPAFLWHTAADGAVPLANSLRFVEAMRSYELTVGLHVFPDGHHGLGLAPENPEIAQWPQLAQYFLRYNCGFNC